MKQSELAWLTNYSSHIYYYVASLKKAATNYEALDTKDDNGAQKKTQPQTNHQEESIPTTSTGKVKCVCFVYEPPLSRKINWFPF